MLTNDDAIPVDDFGSETLTSNDDVKTPAPAEGTSKPKRRGRKPKSNDSETPVLKKMAEKPVVSEKDKTIRKMLKWAGLKDVPPFEQIVKDKVGIKVKIKDIGLFIGGTTDPLLADLAKACPVKNRVNLSAEVVSNQVVAVGTKILQCGRMFTPIQLAKIKEDGALECTSGRHRLAFLGLVYGVDVEVPVYIEEMDLNTARDAVVFANDSRSTKAMERAEHVVMRAVSGNADVKQDELYAKLVTTQFGAKKYCVFSVFERDLPAKFSFSVAFTSSRREGALTTVTNIENYWSQALEWESGVDRKTFDASIKASIDFLNAVVKEMQGFKEFDSKQHLASMTLSALGKYYYEQGVLRAENLVPQAKQIAEKIVMMGDIGRQKHEATYKAMLKAMQK